MPITTSATGYNNTTCHLFHLRLFGCAAHHHPEHAGRADRRGLRIGRRQLHADQLCQGKLQRRRCNGLSGLSSSIFITRNQNYFLPPAGSPTCSRSSIRPSGRSFRLACPGMYRVSVNPGGSMALAFVQNSNYVYYPRQLTRRRPSHIPAARAPGRRPRWTANRRMRPLWCLFQAQSPDAIDATGNSYGAPLASTGRSRRFSLPMAEPPIC